ncbi:hypothetical protein [Burkholderia gladioli]|uniref:hypothetical protein n=1 Tax=Burkholderia gladioli TaxID=28095 RepID=UPI001FC857D6|nr:hypothetical protein [Burkholderia gladioli]
MLRLYEFLSGQEAALRRRLETIPLFRLENGTHVVAREHGEVKAFLPSAIATGFPTMRRAVCSTTEVRQFLTSLGITESDPVDDVIWNVLPKYREQGVDVDGDAYAADIERIRAAFNTDSATQKEKLRSALRDTHFVSHMTTLAGQGAISWSQVQATMNAYAAKGNVNGVQQSDVDAQLTNPKFSTAVDASSALVNPLYAVDGDLTQFIVGSSVSVALSPVRENYTLNGSTLSVTQEIQSNGSWSSASRVGSYDAGFSGSWISLDGGVGAYEMKADGSWTSWLTAAQLHPSYSLSAAGANLVGIDPNTGDTVTVSYRKTDVSSQPLSSALQIDYRNPIRGAMTGSFSSGTTAYLATTTYANDRLLLVNQGLGQPWINGADANSSTIVNGSVLYSLGDPNTTYTSVQQAVGTQTDIGGGCLLLSIQSGGIVQVIESGKLGCNYSNEPISFPVTGSWSAYSRNANVITISLPKSIGAPTVPIDDAIKNTINAGGSLVVGLMKGKLMGGFMLPASASATVAQFPSSVTDTIAASMRAAAAKLGITQNP